MHDRLLRKPEVARITGLSLSTIWRLEKAGDFPSRIQTSPRTVAFSERLVMAWVASRAQATTDTVGVEK